MYFTFNYLGWGFFGVDFFVVLWDLVVFLWGFFTGFGWDKVNFLHSGWYGSKFWIFAGNSLGNSRMF